MRSSILILLASFLVHIQTVAGEDSLSTKKDVRINLNSDGTNYIKFTGLGQYWLRYTDMNPGSTVFGNSSPEYVDMGIRRLRFQAFGQINKHVFFYTQFGLNNFGYVSTHYEGAFFHDALGEVKVSDTKLSIGSGLTSWAGLSRYSAPSAGKIMSLDAPLYQQSTSGLYDQFIRRFTIYGKGQISKFDYRVGVSFPFASQVASTNYPSLTFLNASLSTLPPKPQVNGYIKYQVFEHENNTTPFGVGTYLGAKKVLAFGLGYTIQDGAVAELEVNGDTSYHTMVHIAGDVFLDLPLNESKGTSITWYGAYHYMDYGKNFMLNGGVMNPANGVDANGTINGAGNAFPMRGTGNFLYSQLGFAFGNSILSENGKLQPYVASQITDFEALDEPMIMIESGLNWYITGNHSSKVSFNVQQRPIFVYDTNGDAVVSHYRGMAQLQLQVGF